MSDTLKITDLKPCGLCEGKIAPLFYRVKVTPMAINLNGINQTLGLNQMFGGNALRLAEVFTPDPVAAKPCGEETTVYICHNCYIHECHDLPAAIVAIEMKRAGKEGKERP